MVLKGGTGVKVDGFTYNPILEENLLELAKDWRLEAEVCLQAEQVALELNGESGVKS